jgi:hypothetical protein
VGDRWTIADGFSREEAIEWAYWRNIARVPLVRGLSANYSMAFADAAHRTDSGTQTAATRGRLCLCLPGTCLNGIVGTTAVEKPSRLLEARALGDGDSCSGPARRYSGRLATNNKLIVADLPPVVIVE